MQGRASWTVVRVGERAMGKTDGAQGERWSGLVDDFTRMKRGRIYLRKNTQPFHNSGKDFPTCITERSSAQARSTFVKMHAGGF